MSSAAQEGFIDHQYGTLCTIRKTIMYMAFHLSTVAEHAWVIVASLPQALGAWSVSSQKTHGAR
jgi:hypothetical protein